MLLYAHDELDMATMRLRLRFPGEQVKPHEELYKLHAEEVPARNVGTWRKFTVCIYISLFL
jgi:E3 ubiquitin-protein ligase SHPRH